MYEGYTHESAEDLHYRKVVTVPGDYRTDLEVSYPVSLLPTIPDITEQSRSNHTLVIVDGTPAQRTALGVQVAAMWDAADWRYWREGSYHRQLEILSEYREMAKKLPNRDDITDQFMEYEREFLSLEATGVLFLDQIGTEGFWPNQSGRLINLVDDRHTAKRYTVLAFADNVTEKVPEWDRFLSPRPGIWKVRL